MKKQLKKENLACEPLPTPAPPRRAPDPNQPLHLIAPPPPSLASLSPRASTSLELLLVSCPAGRTLYMLASRIKMAFDQ